LLYWHRTKISFGPSRPAKYRKGQILRTQYRWARAARGRNRVFDMPGPIGIWLRPSRWHQQTLFQLQHTACALDQQRLAISVGACRRRSLKQQKNGGLAFARPPRQGSTHGGRGRGSQGIEDQSRSPRRFDCSAAICALCSATAAFALSAAA